MEILLKHLEHPCNDENDLNPQTLRVAGRSHDTQVKAHLIAVIPKTEDDLRMQPFHKISNSSIMGFKYGLIFFGSFGPGIVLTMIIFSIL